MARLDLQSNNEFYQLIERLLGMIDQARNNEFALLDKYGETAQTISALNELGEVAQQATELYKQLWILRLRVAESQPGVPMDMLALLKQRLDFIQNRIPALERSIIEVQSSWRL